MLVELTGRMKAFRGFKVGVDPAECISEGKGKCRACEHVWEIVEFRGEVHQPTCPICGSEDVIPGGVTHYVTPPGSLVVWGERDAAM